MRLTKWDRDIAHIWIEAGQIPDGHTERQTALRIIEKALCDLDEMRAVLNDLASHNFITVDGPTWQTESLF